MQLDVDLERVRLGHGPTPVRELTELGAERGRAPIWIKDDGAYSVSGGNKARKLEWLLARAVGRGKRTVLTGGALGTNHGLATALFASRLGMRTVLVLVPQPDSEHVRRQLERLRETGAELHFPRGVRRSYLLAAGLFCARMSPPFNFPYFLRPGGSVPLGCVGYVEAVRELTCQIEAGELPTPSHVVVALGSGGTAAGLVAGLKLAGLPSRVVAVLVNDLVRVDEKTVVRLARRTLRLLRTHGANVDGVEVADRDVVVERGWLGDGYGHPTAAAERAIGMLADREGVALEPVYTGKAMAALLELNRRGAFGDGPVLYWHTYGPPEEAETTDPAAPGGEAEEADTTDPAAPGGEAEEAETTDPAAPGGEAEEAETTDPAAPGGEAEEAETTDPAAPGGEAEEAETTDPAAPGGEAEEAAGS